MFRSPDATARRDRNIACCQKWLALAGSHRDVNWYSIAYDMASHCLIVALMTLRCIYTAREYLRHIWKTVGGTGNDVGKISRSDRSALTHSLDGISVLKALRDQPERSVGYALSAALIRQR